jgi:Domain of unknown function (DUF4190)/Domain of unknown function (DUF1707)
VTSDPEPGSSGFPLPPATTPLPGQPLPGQPGYGPPSYGPAPYGPYGPAYVPGGYSGAPGSGYGPFALQGQFAQSGMLAAAADRERTMDVLKAAFTEGRLTQSEFEERSARVLAARTYGELHGLITDLPSGPGAPALHQPYPAPYPGYYPAPPGPHTNGFAVGALVCGFLPFLGGIPAVVLGHVARGQIRRTGERGDGVAVAGLVLGYLWLALWVLIILVSLSQGS